MTEDAFDPSCGRQLKQLLAAGYPKLVGNFLHNTETYIGQITAALAAGDRVAASEIAHKMKSSCGQFGLLELQKRAAEIEHAGALSDDKVRALSDQLKPAYDRACALLRQHGLDS